MDLGKKAPTSDTKERPGKKEGYGERSQTWLAPGKFHSSSPWKMNLICPSIPFYGILSYSISFASVLNQLQREEEILAQQILGMSHYWLSGK